MSRKALRSVYLELEQAEKLKQLSAKTRVPQAVYIREGLDLVMNKYEKKTKRSLSAGKIKDEHASTRTLFKR